MTGRIGLRGAPENGQRQARPGVALVEWPERAPEVLPPDHLELRLSRLGEGRLAELHPHGPRSEALLSRLERRW